MSDHQRREFEKHQKAINDARNGRDNNHPAAHRERQKIEASRPKPGSGKYSGSGSENDGCFASDTPVLTPSGWAEISQIHAGDEVMTWAQDGILRARPVVHVRRKASRQCMRFTVENGGIINVTKAHPLRVGDAWKRADQVRLGDVLPAIGDGQRASGARVTGIELSGVVDDVYHLYCGREHTYVVAHAISHCFSFARPLCGLVLDAAIMLSGPSIQVPKQAACA